MTYGGGQITDAGLEQVLLDVVLERFALLCVPSGLLVVLDGVGIVGLDGLQVSKSNLDLVLEAVDICQPVTFELIHAKTYAREFAAL